MVSNNTSKHLVQLLCATILSALRILMTQLSAQPMSYHCNHLW
jgi:hypothetical protein